MASWRLPAAPFKLQNESWLIMATVIFIRHDLPEDKFYFPAARRTCKKIKKLQKCQLRVYDTPVILALDKTNVRCDLPPS